VEILLLIALAAGGYVLWKQSRGEQPSAGRFAGGCLGLGCLASLLLFIAGIVVLWLLLQAFADLDLSLSGLGENGGDGGGGSGGGGDQPQID
jgi:hypothetical protein